MIEKSYIVQTPHGDFYVTPDEELAKNEMLKLKREADDNLTKMRAALDLSRTIIESARNYMSTAKPPGGAPLLEVLEGAVGAMLPRSAADPTPIDLKFEPVQDISIGEDMVLPVDSYATAIACIACKRPYMALSVSVLKRLKQCPSKQCGKRTMDPSDAAARWYVELARYVAPNKDLEDAIDSVPESVCKRYSASRHHFKIVKCSNGCGIVVPEEDFVDDATYEKNVRSCPSCGETTEKGECWYSEFFDSPRFQDTGGVSVSGDTDTTPKISSLPLPGAVTDQ